MYKYKSSSLVNNPLLFLLHRKVWRLYVNLYGMGKGWGGVLESTGSLLQPFGTVHRASLIHSFKSEDRSGSASVPSGRVLVRKERWMGGAVLWVEEKEAAGGAG